MVGVVQVVLVALAVPVKGLVHRSVAGNGKLAAFLVNHVGLGSHKPKNHEFVATLFLCQMCASFVIVVLWIFKTYAREVSTPVFVVEMVCSVFVAVHYFVNLLKFAGSNVWTMDAVFDVLTVVPLIVQTSFIKTWISWSFLRAVRAFKAYARLESSGALDDVSDFTRAIILAVLKFCALLVCFAGSMFVVEVLGDFDSFYDIFLDTAMGSVSFYQMVYFVMVTVSTVGYGDYSPVTVLGRLFIIVFIVAGVAFFSIETGNIMNIMALTSSGKGKYHPKKKGREHVVVTGGAISQPGGAVISSFLKELCHENHGDSAPEVVLLSLRPPSDQLREFIKETPRLADRVKYICGSPLYKGDLIRARANKATMLYVLGDMSSGEPDKEDEENIMRGAMLNKLLPQINLRLMLLRPENRQVASDIGLPVFMCFSVNEIKSSMMATSVRVQGFGTMALNLIKQDDINAIVAKAKMDGLIVPAWQNAFMEGSSHEIYGFCLASRFSGKTFQDVSLECFKKYQVVLIAVQVKNSGVILLAPGAYTMGKDDVCFAIAKDEEQLDPFRHDEHNWVTLFKARRRSASADLLRKSGPKEEGHLMSRVDVGEEVEEMEDVRAAKSPEEKEAMRNQASGTEGPAQPKMLLPGGLMRHLDAPRSQGSVDSSMPEGLTLSIEEDDDFDAMTVNGEMEKKNQDELLRIVGEGEHVIIVGMSTGLWQQIFAIIKTLRKSWLVRKSNILCITRERAPTKLRKIFPDIAFITGVPQKLPTLKRIGADRARDIVVLSGIPSGGDSHLLDRRAIILSSIINSQLEAWGSKLRKVLELHNPASCNQLMNYSVKKVVEQRVSAVEKQRKTTGVDFGEDVLPEVHPLYAKGEALVRGDFCQLWASAFYTPGILEIVESLLGCGSASLQQKSFPWLVEVPPEFFGGTYEELFNATALEGTTCLGLLRPKLTLGAPEPYVHTCPPPNLKLIAGDQVYILGPSSCSLITTDTW